MPNIVSYGFTNLETLMAQRVVDVQVEVVQRAVEESAMEHTRIMNEMLGQMVTRTIKHQVRYQLPAGGTLQPLDASGNPLPVTPTGVYDVAFPIKGAGTAWGTDRISRAKMTVQDAARFTYDALQKDADWMRRHMLAALFDNTTYTYADPMYGNLTVQPLANGDAVTYVRAGSATPATDTHYLAQANAISNSDNPFPTIYSELDEHPSNSGPYMVYVPSNLVATITALANFREPNDAMYRFGDGVTLLNASNNSMDTRRDNPMSHFGNRLVGAVDGCVIVEWNSLPDSYMLAHASGVNDVLGMREEPEAELQGLFPEVHDVDGNRWVNRLLRYCGFGVMNRVGALVYRVGNGSYAIPSGFSTPLPA
jgi:hypothetical protein